MPRFFKRIFPEHLFRRDATADAAPDVSDLQRSRRVLVRPSASNLYDHASSNWRLGVFYDGYDGVDARVHAEERRALRDGASLAESSSEVLAGEGMRQFGETSATVVVPRRKETRVRRRLSKRHRMPV